MLGQYELCFSVCDVFDLPLQLAHAIADRFGERQVVLYQEQMQSDLHAG